MSKILDLDLTQPLSTQIFEIRRLENELARVSELYADLLYSVQEKIEEETRHETAKRLIQESSMLTDEATPK